MNIKPLNTGLLLFISSLAFAQPSTLEPLASWHKRRPNWESETTEAAYVTTRCGALYSVIGAAFSHYAKTDDDKKRGMDAALRGIKLMYFGDILAKDAGGTAEQSTLRFQEISKLYRETVVYNRTTHTNMFHGFIEYDWKFCIDIEKRLTTSTPKN